jgi:hypothetical protein
MKKIKDKPPIDYGDFTQYEVRCLIAEYCKEITCGTTGWGVPFTAWVQLRRIAKHDKRFRLIKIKEDEEPPTQGRITYKEIKEPAVDFRPYVLKKSFYKDSENFLSLTSDTIADLKYIFGKDNIKIEIINAAIQQLNDKSLEDECFKILDEFLTDEILDGKW